ncbi:MAG: DUF493 family protein [Nannocystaceae bacterium]
MSRQTAPSRELLLANHAFPGEYMIKAFGPNQADFKSAVVGCAVGVLSESRVNVSERTTPSGHRCCITLNLDVDSVEEVEAVYAEIHTLEALALIF